MGVKFLKKFEDTEDTEEYKPKNYYGKFYYWLVPTDDRFEDSMRKIGCPEKFINRKLEFDFSEYKYIFISYSGYDSGGMKYDDVDKWGWNNYDGEIPNKFYNKEAS